MPKQINPYGNRVQANAELNTFNRGLITEASPLTFPDNASLYENNMLINKDGSRQRRLGMDCEDSFVEVATTLTDADTIPSATSTYKWENAGNSPDKELLVVQVGNELKFFDLDISPISTGLIGTVWMSTTSREQVYSYSVIDGLLVVATGLKQVTVIEFDGVSTISTTNATLLIRDFFGLQAYWNGSNLRQGSGYKKRPDQWGLDEENHIYNLRNQGWGTPKIQTDGDTVFDTLLQFRFGAFNYWQSFPSNSDTVVEALHPNAASTLDRNVDRFYAEEVFDSPVLTSPAPLGYFIIDALERGSSRFAQYQDNRFVFWQQNDDIFTAFNEDKTPGGPTTTSEYAGRVFFGGFDGTVIDGDEHSPSMSSYVLFSQLVNNIQDIPKCYQEGDPTSRDAPEVIDTDGGFIKVDEAYGIQKLVNIGSSLFVVASNGVWRITGDDGNRFTATSHLVQKVSEHGSRGVNTIVVVDGTLMYWGDDGIYHIKQNEFGDWVAENITQKTIQKFYNAIPLEHKDAADGFYDSYENKIRWIYSNRISDDDEVEELVFDVNVGAFYTNIISKLAGTNLPKIISVFEQQPYNLFSTIQPVTNSALVAVTDSALDPVTITVESRRSITRVVGYVVVTEVTPVVKISFASYTNTDFVDWYSIDSTGVDAPALLITGYTSGGDFQRYKQATYLTVHMNRTEIAYALDGSGNIVDTPQSSCLVKAQWEWADSPVSGRWSREFQAYRYRRHYVPASVNDDFDYGFTTIVTKNKIRGKGRVLSLSFASEPLKDLHLYGWSLGLTVGKAL